MQQSYNKELVNFIAHKALEIRIDSIRSTSKAGSGHPTSCLSAADIIAVLFFHVLRYDFDNHDNPDNDRFVLSKGHAVPVFYAALRQRGIITDKQLLSLRDVNSVFEGHPTPRFVHNQAATGSLGQGLSIGLGLALNARLEKRSYKTYVLLGDGELAEGSVWEAAELAVHYSVGQLIAVIDCNRLAQSGVSIDAHQINRYKDKFEAFGWHVIVVDGNCIEQLLLAFDQAHSITTKPVIIVAKTLKGYGLDDIQDMHGYHGKPFKETEVSSVIAKLKARFASVVDYQGSYQVTIPHPIQSMHPAKSCNQSNNEPIQLNISNSSLCSTRKAFGIALAELGKKDDQVVVLDADVKNSTYTDIFEQLFPERFVQCFIAEQNMVGVATGLALRHKIPFAATFGAFFARAYDQIRMAGIGRVALRLVGSHCGVSIGQDGPSQMALEDIAMMAAIPNSVILYPSDAVATASLVSVMAGYDQGISYLRTTRADLPVLYDYDERFDIGGCKVLRSSDCDKLCIVAAGITLHESLKAYEILALQGIFVSVIDAYSIKPLDVKTIRRVAALSDNKVVTVEDHYLQGGIGQIVAAGLCNDDISVHILAVTDIARSGSPEALMELVKIDAQSIVQKIKQLI